MFTHLVEGPVFALRLPFHWTDMLLECYGMQESDPRPGARVWSSSWFVNLSCVSSCLFAELHYATMLHLFPKENIGRRKILRETATSDPWDPKVLCCAAFWGEELHNLRHWWTLIGMEATKVEQCWTLLNIIEQRVGWRYSFSTRWRHRRLMVLLRRCILRHGLFAKKSADLWLLFTLSSREWKVSFQKWFANVDLCSHMYSRLLKQKCT
jgi:hypothetical protein